MTLLLQLINEAAAEKIVAGGCPAGHRCAPDYPAEADRIAAGLFLERCAAGVDPRPYGAFLVCLPERSPEPPLVIGGIGFHGGSDERGRVEIGYGIVASHQGRGYATAALRLLVERAYELGAVTLTAATDSANQASHAVLLRSGFARARVDGRTICFERALR